MRIRKRQPFLSSSSLSPLHLSDPHLLNRSPVLVQLADATHTAPKPSSSLQHAIAPSSLDRYQPFDQQLQLIGKPTNGSVHHDPSGIGKSGAHNKQQQHPLEEKVKGEEEKGNHTSKGGILVSQISPSSSTSAAQDERWWEGEKVIPLKKRRGSFENGMMVKNNKKMKAMMKTKMNKKCNIQKGEDDDDEEEQLDAKVAATSKKRTKGSAVMEGSRCSRVNGRGWRCCQQTLVGYSLCEHHLGKGRLRSMTSVRNRSTGTTTAPNKGVVVMHDNDNIVSVVSADSSSSSIEKQATNCGNGVDDAALKNDDHDDEKKKKKKVMSTTKKRMKLGMVKARSISSLLGQTSTQLAQVAVDEEMINQNK